MTDRTIDTRCLDCGGEFASAEHPAAKACPGCGSTSVPDNPQHDRDWTLSDADWNVLALGAFLFASFHSDDGMMACSHNLRRRIFCPNGEAIVPPLLMPVQAGDDDRARMRTVRLSSHALRVLTFWTSRLLNSTSEGRGTFSDSDFEPILTKIRSQQTAPFALTLEDEIGEIRKDFPDSTVELRYTQADGTQ